MRLFSHTSKLCLLTLLLMFVSGRDGQNTGHRGKCGVRPLDHRYLTNYINLGRSPAGTAESNSAADDLNFTRSIDSYSGERIVGGHAAKPGEFPWQGRIQIFTDTNDLVGEHKCGAVIISEYWLLTAAHCVNIKYFYEWTYRIHVGDRDRTKNDEGEQVFKVQNIILHEVYNNKRADIALIKIQPNKGRGIQFNRNVQPVCLPDQWTRFETHTKCMVSGWGGTLDASLGPNPEILRGAVVPIVNHGECQRMYAVDGGKIQNNEICAGYPEGGVDACQLDSGGPLVCKQGRVYTLCGIVSWGKRCALPNFSGVYARVTAFLPWIHKTINSRSSNSAEKFIPTNP